MCALKSRRSIEQNRIYNMMNAVGHETAIHTPGAKSGRAGAVGQQAKVAVAAAREAGVELPKNAQGHAASAIARGAAPESVFAALVSPPTGDGGSSTGDAVDVAPTDTGDVPDVAVGDTDPIVETVPAEDEAAAPPEVVLEGDDVLVEIPVIVSPSGAEIALETLVSEELDEVLCLG
jgi:hypothetical protein